MKRFCFLFCFFILVCSLLVPAYAAEEGEGSTAPDVAVYNEVIIPDQDPGVYLGSSVSYAATYSGSDSSLKSVLIDFLGEWQTVVVEHSYETSDGTITTVHETQPDYPWLCAAGLLCLMIFCLFRLGGAVLCKT